MKLLVWFLAVFGSMQLLAVVQLNSATVEELAQLKGIGKVKAERIVEYRNEHEFQNTRELMNVKGIGQKTYDRIKDDLQL